MSALSLRAPRRFAFDGWESSRPSVGSEWDSATAFIKPPLDQPDVPTIQGSPYVKHGSGITLLLLGHKAGTTFPAYQSGSVLNGMVVLAKPAGVASLEVKVRGLQFTAALLKLILCQLEGSVSVREIQGGGRSSTVFYSDQLITWDATGASLPDEFSFRRIVPIFSDAGRLLPPTFDSRLSAIPGFRVSVIWSIVVSVTRTRTGPLSLFRRTTRCVYLQYLSFRGLTLLRMARVLGSQVDCAVRIRSTYTATFPGTISDSIYTFIAFTTTHVLC